MGAILKHSGLELVAVADIYRKLLQDFSDWNLTMNEDAPIAVYEDYQQMMYEKPNIVIIATPPVTHAQIAKNVMRYESVDCIVLEKPACETAPEGAMLLAAQKEYGVPVIVNHSRRYMDNWGAFVAKVEAEKPTLRAIGICNGDPLDAGVHMFDLFNWIKPKRFEYIDMYDKDLGKYRPYLIFDLLTFNEFGMMAIVNNGHTIIEAPRGTRAYRDLDEILWDEAFTTFHYDQVELEKAMLKMYGEAADLATGRRKKPACSLKDGVKAVEMALKHKLLGN